MQNNTLNNVTQVLLYAVVSSLYDNRMPEQTELITENIRDIAASFDAQGENVGNLLDITPEMTEKALGGIVELAVNRAES
ncbi:hypothetical protein AHIS2_p010 [Acaryochloris phage A-HIS2]|nr:hypothetical protein AHIS2_p010 [Acaryochloris phage A-HIS2]